MFIGRLAFRASFHNWHALRRAILRAAGASIAPTARIRPTVRINCPWNLSVGDHTAIGDRVIIDASAPVVIGSRSTISQYSCIFTTDEQPDAPPERRPVTIGSDCWIATDTYIEPGVRIEDQTVVGARSTVRSDLPPAAVCAGDPARPTARRIWKRGASPDCGALS
jgi:putative colanic acid biosynthesis acetyltransferase WcaF